MMGDKKMVLPPGFQFDPTDEELIVYFLCRKAASLPCCSNIIPDLDYYAADPWGINEKAFWSKGEWYFFSRLKQNRSTRRGFWKETGPSEPIFASNGDEVGIKRHLVYNFADIQVGPNLQTNWTMKEYHLHKVGFSKKPSHQIGENQLQLDMNEWVLCRVHDQENSQGSDYYYQKSNSGDGVELSYLDEVFFSMEDDDQEEITFPS